MMKKNEKEGGRMVVGLDGLGRAGDWPLSEWPRPVMGLVRARACWLIGCAAPNRMLLHCLFSRAPPTM